MNECLYATCAALPDEDRRADRGAFFRSIHGTLNHLLLGDLIWLGRFRGGTFPVASLDEELHADFPGLRREREATDREIETWVRGLTPQALAAPLRFRSITQDRERVFPLHHLAIHFFNHQTHHRGQITTLLFQCGVDPGVTDLLWLPGEESTTQEV